MKRFFAAFIFLILALCVSSASVLADVRLGSYHVPVLIRPGVGALLEFPVYSNPNRRVRGVTIVAVPGLGHTAGSFRAFAEHIFSTPSFRNRVERIVAIEFPGKGDSSLPFPRNRLLFGELTLADYAKILISGLRYIDWRTREPMVVVAHSMGGMVAQLAEQRLQNEGTSLRREFNVRGVSLVAPSIPREVPWFLSDSGLFAQLASQFVTQSPELGTYVSVPLEVFIGLFLANRAGQPVISDPFSVDPFRANESFLAAAELGGVLSPRPSIASGIFGNDGRDFLSVVAMQEDGLYVYPTEHQALFDHLGGDTGGFFAVNDPLSVHDAYIVAPELLNSALSYHLH